MVENRRQFVNRAYLLVLILLLTACSALSPVAPPPTPTPDVTVCASGCDFTTLQAAIDAESTASGDVIAVQEAVHTEAAIVIHKSVTIQGNGADATIVQADPQPETATERVFSIPDGVTVTLRALTIRHGNPHTTPESGGGVRNEGTLTVENCLITANSGSAGGGIHNGGTLTAINTTISHNLARGGADAQYECNTGGGIKDMEGLVTLRNSTVSDNRAEGKGGGIHVACKGILVLENTVIRANSTLDDGGGVYIDGVGYFTRATLSANVAKTGGGVYLSGSGERNLIRGQLNYTATLIAANTAQMEKYGVADCMFGDHASLGANVNNWVGDGTCSPAHTGAPTAVPRDIGARGD
ncbi:MAG TPA: hypothetical protein PKH77_08310 [Anaerolineae bacterium]|nr:hypothetical protein [Anaerolineae bacterium]